MHSDRRAILHLVALGRITSAEAERLLIACNQAREGLWVLAACMVISCLTQLMPHPLPTGLVHIAHSLLPASSISVRRVLSLLNHLLGGGIV